MHVKRTVTIVLVGGALAAWLAGAATSNRAVPDPILPHPARIDARGADLAGEIARLHDRLRPATTPRAPSRNVFRFSAPNAAPVAAPAAHPALIESPALPKAAPLLPLRLSGIAEDPGADGPVRVAIISGEGQLYMAKVGELVTPRYRVTQIGADVVELLDLRDRDHSTTCPQITIAFHHEDHEVHEVHERFVEAQMLFGVSLRALRVFVINRR